MTVDTAVTFTDTEVEKRFLSAPTTPPIRIDEHENLARSFFGVNVANFIIELRSHRLVSGILFSSSILFFALGSVHWTCVAFDYDSFIANSSALIILFWITFSLSCIQLLSSTLRLVTSLLLMCLMSFDVWYLLSQVWSCLASFIYIHHADSLVTAYMIYCCWMLSNLAVSDAMTEQSRLKSGLVPLYGSTVLLAAMLFNSRFTIGSRGESFQLPGSSLLMAVGLQPLMANPNEFLAERLVVLMIFAVRYIYKSRAYPDAALNLSVSYERHTQETVVIVPPQAIQPLVITGHNVRVLADENPIYQNHTTVLSSTAVPVLMTRDVAHKMNSPLNNNNTSNLFTQHMVNVAGAATAVNLQIQAMTHPIDLVTVPPVSGIGISTIQDIASEEHIRFLVIPPSESYSIDEQTIVGSSLFGPRVAKFLVCARDNKLFSGITYALGNAFPLFCTVLLCLGCFNDDANQQYAWLRALCWSLLPFGVWTVAAGSMRLHTRLVFLAAGSFDVWYLTAQMWTALASLSYIYRNDSLFNLWWLVCGWASQNVIFSDSMSERSRARAGTSFMLVNIVINVGIVCVLKLSLQASSSAIVLPGSAWLKSAHMLPLQFNPLDFFIERQCTLVLFFIRFLWKMYHQPNAALNLNVSYVRQNRI